MARRSGSGFQAHTTATAPLPADTSGSKSRAAVPRYVGAVGPVTNGAFFAASAETAGALTGLLFVALSVSPRRDPTAGPAVIREVRAAAALLAFSNALFVSLFSLVPGTNAGYPSIVFGVIGILYTAAAVRSIRTSESTLRQQARQLGLIGLLLVIFGTEFISGIVALIFPSRAGPVEVIGYTVVASLVVGVARAWELVGTRDTGILASLAVLAGRQHGLAGTASGDAPEPRGGRPGGE
jgi:hypothetical protein